MLTDQPGCVAALVVVAPAMMYASVRLVTPECEALACRRGVARVLGAFAVVFWLYELFWICNYPPKRIVLPPR